MKEKIVSKMEFTPKKQMIPSYKNNGKRTNPYTTRGRTYLNRFKRQPGSVSSPPATYTGPQSKTTPRRFFSRTDRILSNSVSKTSHDTGGGRSNLGKWIDKNGASPQCAKRPFSAVNGVEKGKNLYSLCDSDVEILDVKKKSNSEDPYTLYSESDSESLESKGKASDNKENSLFSPPKHSTKKVLVYSNKKKNVPRSRLHREDSAEKLDDEFFERSKVTSEKDSCSAFSDSDHEYYEKQNHTCDNKVNSIFSSSRLSRQKDTNHTSKKRSLNFSRSRLLSDISPEKIERAYGTKYLSGAEKENVPTESTASSTDIITSPHLIGFPNYGNTCYLNSVLQALFGLPPFVCDTQVLASQLNLPSTSLSHGLTQVLSSRTKGQVTGVKHALRTVKENLVRVDETFSGFKMQDANEFLTRILDTTKDEIDRCHMTTPSPDRIQNTVSVFSAASEQQADEDVLLSGHLGSVFDEVDKKILHSSSCTEGEDGGGDILSAFAQRNISMSGEKCEVEIPSAISSDNPSETCDPRMTTRQQVTPMKNSGESMPRNPVKDNFEFQLHESYRCLGCGEVVGRNQEYFGLYMNLPEPEEGQDSIQDAIAAYMGADERELKCSKCGHNQSSVVTSVTRLPRVLIIQLKRYEYRAEQCESIKRSSRVHVNRWLSLDSHMTDAVSSPSHWDPQAGRFVTPRTPKQATLTVRNLSSELNVCDGIKDKDDELPNLSSPTKVSGSITITPAADKEDEELQEVMRRSMDDVGGTKEEDEIQQAIRLSLQDLGMSYTQENQAEKEGCGGDDNDNSKDQVAVEENVGDGCHSYRLISIISHFGLTTNTGHYVADVYNTEEDTWLHYDDECVTKIPESVVFAEGRQKNGYIFFYIHKNVLKKISDSSSHQR